MLGIDRVPEVKTIRRKIAELARARPIHLPLTDSVVGQPHLLLPMGNMYVCIDISADLIVGAARFDRFSQPTFSRCQALTDSPSA